MRLPTLVRSAVLAGASLALASLAAGCATTMSNSSGQDRVVVAVDTPPASSSDVQITEMIAAPAPEVAPPRRRLSQTVTLGQESYAPAPAPAQPQGNGQGGTSVIVNNNVTVVNQPPVVYGGGYYGGYGGGYGAGYGGAPIRDTRGSHQAWAPNGWEGAGRTAAPGVTPRVGGNFSPPPSYGPRAMK